MPTSLNNGLVIATEKKIHGDEYGAATIKTISGNYMKCKLCFNNKRKEVFPQTEIPSLSTILSLKLTGQVFQRNKNGGQILSSELAAREVHIRLSRG